MKKLILITCILLIESINNNAQEIFDAVKINDLTKVKTLVEKDTSVINLKDIGGITPLHQAAIVGSTQIVEYLLSKRANLNAVDSRGYTPLHYSCQYNFESIAKLLIEPQRGRCLSRVPHLTQRECASKFC